jgi:histidinol phosphatase-like enzyme
MIVVILGTNEGGIRTGTYSLATSDASRNALVYQRSSGGNAKLTSVVICNGLSKDLVNIRKKVSNLNDKRILLKAYMLKHSLLQYDRTRFKDITTRI